MFMPNLLRNFLYTRHNSGCWPLDFIMQLVASELHVCANFSRKFFWSSKSTPGRVAWIFNHGLGPRLCEVHLCLSPNPGPSRCHDTVLAIGCMAGSMVNHGQDGKAFGGYRIAES